MRKLFKPSKARSEMRCWNMQTPHAKCQMKREKSREQKWEKINKYIHNDDGDDVDDDENQQTFNQQINTKDNFQCDWEIESSWTLMLELDHMKHTDINTSSKGPKNNLNK